MPTETGPGFGPGLWSWVPASIHCYSYFHSREINDTLFCQCVIWVIHTCPPVHLSTCLPGLTGPEADNMNVFTGSEVNIGEQGIMGITYLSTCRPVYQG